ncbi:tyrosine-type recombinase/integrase [Crossiella sp. CA198]|uniref:tyrosine-type recombinase/integrase n=1 Tax=Crossiella sp. CA198 TaxID=3455607 RepID=UPI003F8D85E8
MLGDIPVSKLTAWTLETLYTELLHCRIRYDRRPYIEKHAKDESHDCKIEGCKPHVCRPLARSSVRQVAAIISGALDAAIRWEWISTNPAKVAQKPKAQPPQPSPPSAAEAACLVDEAFRMDGKDNDDWGTLVWLVMTTGIRRGEVCALRWSRIDLDEGIIEIRKSYSRRGGIGREKDTKTHQMRRIALDTETTVLLREHKSRAAARLAGLGVELKDDMYVFTGTRNFTYTSRTRLTPCQVGIRRWPSVFISTRTYMLSGITRPPSC